MSAQTLDQALEIDRLGPDGGIHVDRLPGHASRDDGDAPDDHRRRRTAAEGGDEGAQSLEKGSVSPVGHG